MNSKLDLFNNLDSIIFDLDGTLWDSTNEVLISWNKALKNYDEIREYFTKETIEGYMGTPMDKIFESFFHYLEADRIKEIQDQCNNYELEYLKKHGGILYPNVENVLATLNEKYKLFIVSNCQNGYIETFLDFYGLQKYFIDYELSGRTNLPKGENIKLVIERNNLNKPIYVGDTDGDSKAARHAGIPFVYARYGFGETNGFDWAVDNVEELIKLWRNYSTF